MEAVTTINLAGIPVGTLVAGPVAKDLVDWGYATQVDKKPAKADPTTTGPKED